MLPVVELAVPITPQRVVAFKPSGVLNEKLNPR
jgi:hypothetical protein